MSRVDDVTRGELANILKRLRALEKATPQASLSMGNGQMRLYDGSVLLIQDGNLVVTGSGSVSGTLTVSGEEDVTGTLKVTGTLEADGTIKFTGTLTATGPTNLNGPVNIGGNAKVTGTLEIDGASTLKDDLTVTSGGTIKVGALTLSPSLAGGGTVGGITATSVVLIQAPNGAVVNGGLQVNGGPVAAENGIMGQFPPAPGGVSPNVYMDEFGTIYRI